MSLRSNKGFTMKSDQGKIVFRLAGDTGLIAEFGEGIDPDVNAKVRTAASRLAEKKPKGVVEIIPTYRSLLLIYDPLKTGTEELMCLLETINVDMPAGDETGTRKVDIPVCYGGKFGPDIDNVKASSGLDEETVIQLHSGVDYLIFMVGFTPGFPFLGGLDERLTTPRLKTPRMAVPEGSVGIANNQTGMYPIESPGGWQIIGRTPLKLFAPERENPFLYKAGDWIRFVPISSKEYDRIKKEKQN